VGPLEMAILLRLLTTTERRRRLDCLDAIAAAQRLDSGRNASWGKADVRGVLAADAAH